MTVALVTLLQVLGIIALVLYIVRSFRGTP